MSFGKMRDIIAVLEKNSEVVDSHTEDEYTEIKKIRGYIKPTAGNKFFEAAAISAERIVTIIIRFDSSVKESCRLKCDGVDYRIISVVDIENRHRYLDIKCEAIVNG